MSIILCIDIYELVWFLRIIDDIYVNYNILFVTFRYLATGDAITSIGYNFWTGMSTAR